MHERHGIKTFLWGEISHLYIFQPDPQKLTQSLNCTLESLLNRDMNLASSIDIVALQMLLNK
jgi:hypothetical protein